MRNPDTQYLKVNPTPCSGGVCVGGEGDVCCCYFCWGGMGVVTERTVKKSVRVEKLELLVES